MNKDCEIVLLENNELINLSDEEAIYLDEEAINERIKIINRLKYLRSKNED